MTLDLTHPVLELASAWAGAGRDPTVHADVLRRHETLLADPDLGDQLHVLAFLYPGDPRLDALASILRQGEEDGLDTVTSGR